MHTELAPEFIGTPEGEKAKEVIANCVHCGFCNATCPTYQILGDELDGPRGRIYLMKEMFEGKEVSAITREHLDRCLTCRACETTCPSGVKYSELVEVGRRVMERKVKRSFAEHAKRVVLKELVARPAVFKRAANIGYAVKPMLSAKVQSLLPTRPENTRGLPVGNNPRTMLVLEGCVQPTLTPQTNAAAIRVLDILGITLKSVPRAGCCGAVRHHMNDLEGAKVDARRNIDAWWPYIESAQAEAIVSTASGCGVQLEHYGELMKDEPEYAEKAAKISSLSMDISLIVQNELLALDSSALPQAKQPLKIAVQDPCSFQHALQNKATVGPLLTRFGHISVPTRDGHLCCGSAGTYSVLQPELSKELRTRKIDSLQVSSPDMIVTANVGCYGHLSAELTIPIKHWIEVVDDVLFESGIKTIETLKTPATA